MFSLFVLNGVLLSKELRCLGWSIWNSRDPTEHNGGSYRAFVTSIQCPINISEAHSNGLSDISGLSGNILVTIEPDNNFYIVNIKLFMDNLNISYRLYNFIQKWNHGWIPSCKLFFQKNNPHTSLTTCSFCYNDVISLSLINSQLIQISLITEIKPHCHGTRPSVGNA